MNKISMHIIFFAGFLLLAGTAMSSISYAQSTRFREFANAYPKAADIAPDFTLKTLDGEILKQVSDYLHDDSKRSS